MRNDFFLKQVGTLRGTAGVSLTAGVEVIEVDGLLVTIITTQGVTAEPDFGAIEVAGLTVALTIGGDISPGVGGIEITGLMPGTITGIVNVGADTIEITGELPVWSGGADPVEAGTAAIIEVVGLLASETIGVGETAGVDTIEITGLLANESVGAALIPGTDSIEVTGLQADFSLSVSVTPGTDSIDITGLLATVDAFSQFEGTIDTHGPIHWYRFNDPDPETEAIDSGTEAHDIAVDPAGTGTTVTSVSADIPATDFVMRLFDSDGTPPTGAVANEFYTDFGIDLASDWTYVGLYRRQDYTGGDTESHTLWDVEATNGGGDRLFARLRLGDHPTFDFIFFDWEDDGGTQRTIQLDEPGLDLDAWMMFAVTYDADGGASGNPIVRLNVIPLGTDDEPIMVYKDDIANGMAGDADVAPTYVIDSWRLPKTGTTSDPLDHLFSNWVWFQKALTYGEILELAEQGMAYSNDREVAPVWLGVTTDSFGAVSTMAVDLPGTIESGDLLIACATSDDNGSLHAPQASGAPTVSGPTTTTTTTTTTHTANIPSVVAGDLLVAIVALDNTSAMTVSGDWVKKAENPFGGGSTCVFLLRCDGTETSTSQVFTSGTSADAAIHVFKVAAVDEWHWTGDILDAVSVSSTSESTGTGPDPPNHIPDTSASIGGSDQYYHYIAVCAVDASETFSVDPTSYTGGTTTSTSNVTLRTAERAVAADQENPSAFTKSASAAYSAYSVAIWPGEWVRSYSSGSSGKLIAMFFRIADGTEGATETFRGHTSGGGQETSWHVHQIAKGTYQGIPESGTGIQHVSAEPDPPNVTASWAATKSLWFVHSVTLDGTLDGSPYTGLGTEDINLQRTLHSWGGVNHRHITDLVPEDAASKNPSVFSMFSTNPSSSQTNTFGLQGVVASPQTVIDAWSRNCGLHVAADDITTLWQDSTRTTQVAANGDTVEAWDDISGNARNLTNATGTLTYSATGLLGHPAVGSANLSTDYLLSAAWTHGTPATILAIARNDDASGTSYFDGQANGGSGVKVWWAADAGTGTGPGFFDGSHTAWGTTVENAADVFAVVFDLREKGGSASNSALYRGRGATQVGSDTSFSSWSQNSGHSLFNLSTGGGNGEKMIAEYMFIPGILHTMWHDDLVLALANKYGTP